MYMQWGERIICILPCKRVVSFVGIVIMRGCMGRRPNQDHILDSQQTCFFDKGGVMGCHEGVQGYQGLF